MMAWSDEAKKRAIYVFETLLVDDGPIREQMQARLRAALDAAAAVDGDARADFTTVTAYESGFEAGKKEAGDAQWNAAIEAAASISEAFGPSRPLAERKPPERIYGRWEGEQAASAGIANDIRSLKRLK
jgi:hypothetical protein